MFIAAAPRCIVATSTRHDRPDRRKYGTSVAVSNGMLDPDRREWRRRIVVRRALCDTVPGPRRKAQPHAGPATVRTEQSMNLPGIAFTEDAERRLIAAFAPGPVPAALDAVTLRTFAGSRGYADLLFDDKALEALVANIRRGEACELTIARRADAEYRVEIAPDKMIAWLTVVAACGGKPADALEAVAVDVAVPV